MTELDDRLDEGREAVSTMGPPEDLWTRVIQRANDGDASTLDLTVAGRQRPPRWLALVAVAACLAVVVAVFAVMESSRKVVDTIEPVDPPTSADAPDDRASILAKGDGTLVGQPLSIDAVERDGEVSGELRIGSVVITLQCTGTRSFSIDESTGRRDLIIGGQVTDNPDDLATLDDAGVAVGDLVALIIREDRPELGQRLTLYEPSLWHGEQATAGSCDDLVESVPLNLDGGFFNGGTGRDIDTG